MRASGAASEGIELVPGAASGQALVLDEPLSFWGGLDPGSGRLIDRHHPQVGQTVTERVLVLPGGRGSSSSSTVLAEALRLRTGPVGVLLAEVDPIVMVGSLVAGELYGLECPVVVVPFSFYQSIRTDDRLLIEAGGTVRNLG